MSTYSDPEYFRAQGYNSCLDDILDLLDAQNAAEGKLEANTGQIKKAPKKAPKSINKPVEPLGHNSDNGYAELFDYLAHGKSSLEK